MWVLSSAASSITPLHNPFTARIGTAEPRRVAALHDPLNALQAAVRPNRLGRLCATRATPRLPPRLPPRLVALLNALGIRFVMRCDNDGGWSAAKKFMRSAAAEANVSLNAPSADEVCDCACPAGPPALRLVRQVAPQRQSPFAGRQPGR